MLSDVFHSEVSKNKSASPMFSFCNTPKTLSFRAEDEYEMIDQNFSFIFLIDTSRCI